MIRDHSKPAGPPLPPLEPGDRWLSSAEARELLGGVGKASLLRIQQKHQFHAHRDPVDRRKVWYKLSDVERVKRERKGNTGR